MSDEQPHPAIDVHRMGQLMQAMSVLARGHGFYEVLGAAENFVARVILANTEDEEAAARLADAVAVDIRTVLKLHHAMGRVHNEAGHG